MKAVRPQSPQVMAESRRVQLTTLSCDGPPHSDGPPPARTSPPGVLQGNETGPDRPAVRLLLTLFESDERSFPEFSYSQLVEQKINHRKDEVPLGKFEEEEKRENEEASAFARRLEDKYGGKPKKKKDRIQDLIDIGYGYDEEDSFIDNSEAYDEFVPASITTTFGGFYVNAGVLQFRQASDTDDLTADEKMLEPSKKRKLNGRQNKPKKKSCGEGGKMKSSVDPKLGTSSEIGPGDEMKLKKKKKRGGTLSVTSILKKFQRQKERQKIKNANQKVEAIAGAPTIPLCPADAAGGGGSGLTNPLLSLIASTTDHVLIQAANTLDFDIDLDSLLDASEETTPPKMLPEPATAFQPETDDQTQAQPPNTKTNLQPKFHSEQIQLSSQSSCSSPHRVPLPEGLAPGLKDSVRQLVMAAKTSEGESKLKFFTPQINSILLDIELQCREQGGQLRSRVYTHLSSFLPCSRDTLLKRVKKLLLSHMPPECDTDQKEPPDVDDPVHKLKEAIGKAMPEQIAVFMETCKAYEQVKASKVMEEEKEGKPKVNVGPEDNVEEKSGGRRGGGPKKLFKWNEEIRQCLGHVLRVKMERYKKDGNGSQEMEEYLKTLLDNEVKPLWPKGWMQSRVLIRESRKMLSLFMSLPVKRARTEKKTPSIIGPPATSDGCSVLQPSSPPTMSGGVFKGCLPLKVLPQEAVIDFIESSNISTSLSLGTALEKVEGKMEGGMAVDIGFSAPAEPDEPPVKATSAPTPSLLDLLADQALAREQPHLAPQELLAAAVAKCKHSFQHRSFGFNPKSPPFPPPPPQSSPVSFPVCPIIFPQQLQVRDFARHMEVGQVQIIADDADITIQ